MKKIEKSITSINPKNINISKDKKIDIKDKDNQSKLKKVFLIHILKTQ